MNMEQNFDSTIYNGNNFKKVGLAKCLYNFDTNISIYFQTTHLDYHLLLVQNY